MKPDFMSFHKIVFVNEWSIGMGGGDWLIIYGGNGLFMLIRLIPRAGC